MQIKFNVPKTRIMFITEGGTEYKNLMNFPALLKEGPFFYVPAKRHVVFNVVSRLRTAFKKIAIDKDVYEFMSAPMKLLPLPESFKFITKPLDFQEIALRYLYTVGSGGLLLDPGMGKSKVVLDYIALMGFKKSIVVCPLPLTFVWVDEVAKHRPDLTIGVIETTDWEKEWTKHKDKDIICMNYSKAVIFYEQLKKQEFNFIHLDEFLVKDPATIRTQTITKLAKSIPYKCGGSGTLINNSILDVFAPIRFLEPGLVGENYTNFHNRHTYKNPKVPKMVVGCVKVPEARSILESCCIVMTKEEWLKLPPKKIVDIHVSLPEEQKTVYSSLMRNYIANYEGLTWEIDNALVMMSKLFQIANGFMYYSPEPDKEEVANMLAMNEVVAKRSKKISNRITKFFKEQPKIDRMIRLLKEECKGKRGIIWFNNGAEFTLIKAALEKEGFPFISIQGGDKKIGDKVREFNRNPNIPWLVCQAKSVNYGITVLGTSADKLENSDIEVLPEFAPEVHTQIFYSCNFSLEVFLQQQDRVHRIGQKYDCTYYRLFTNASVEKTIRDALDTKMCIRESMLIDIAEKLRDDSELLPEIEGIEN